MSSLAGISDVPRDSRGVATSRSSCAETVDIHTRLLKCALCLDETRAYWSNVDAGKPRESAGKAFHDSWFGQKSERWVEVLLSNMRARFDAYPDALWVLSRWRHMEPEVRALICHFHLQLTDPMYRAFSGDYLPERRDFSAEISHAGVIRWVGEQGPGRWTSATRTQLASRLLSCAHHAGLVKGTRDPRSLLYPRVPDVVLGYVLHLLRGIDFEGSLVDNPYLRSLGLTGMSLIERLRTLPGVRYQSLGDACNFEWAYGDLRDWARASVLEEGV